MRKILAFLVLLMLPWAARGQALADWYYWFDMEEAPHESGFVSSQQFQLPVDVSHLDWGLHTLYVQVKDTAGVYSTPHGEVFYNIPGNGQKLSSFCYWFDGDIDVNELPYNNGSYQIDITGLNSGFHFINYYVKDELGGMTSFKSSGFYRMPMFSRQKLNYWFAGDTSVTPVADYRDGFIVDVTRLQEGFNTIYFQMEDNGPTDIQSYSFIKVPQTENAGDMTLICIIDGQVVGQEKIAAHGGVVKCDMDVSNIEVGMHKAMFQLISPSGAGSSIAETYFIRTFTNDDIASMQCSYTIDGMHHRVHKGTCTNGTFHFDLPVDEVEDGLHRIDFMLIAENGANTTQGNAWFFKTPLGGNAIKLYDYWLNDKSDEVHSVTLESPQDPFQLVKLLPVTAEPIRSSCFHFEAKDSKLMVYAKNDIHFRFHDKSGRWVDDDRQYVDYNVSEAVTEIADLQITQTFTRPSDNTIKWFKFEAITGDSVAFKVNQATTIQVFSPSGKEIFNVSGDRSMKYSGVHTWEDGSYYVAVHDVTGSKNSITLDYLHLDKYAVLSHTPTVQGNLESTFTIDLFGNGFDKLESAVLKYEDNILTNDTIVISDISNTTLYFTIEEVIENGSYDLILTYSDNGEKSDLIVKDALRIEQPVFGDIAVKVNDARNNADPVSVTISITNPGNVSYSYVPFNIAWDNVDEVKQIVFDNFWLSVPKELDSLGYSNVVITDNLLGKGVRGGVMFMFIPTLKAHETIDVKLDITFTKTRSTAKMYGWCGIPLECDTTLQKYARHAKMRAYNADQARNILSAADAIEAATGTRRTPEPIALAGNLTNTAAKLGVTLAGISEGLDHNVDMAYIDNYNIRDFDPYLAEEIAGLHGKNMLTPGEIIGGQLGEVFDNLMGYHRNCAESSDPTPQSSGFVTRVNSCEPNDLRGYTSESGSTFMRNDIEEVTYIIDSENDPVFADAPAHLVIITDTIQSAFYDLESLSTRNITIGDVSMDLDGTEQNFIKTMDLRPRINVIAQVEQKYDSKTGIAQWIWTSLDPMTMEPTDDVMQGVLPVNDDSHIGEGHITYRLRQKAGLPDGAVLTNQADIIFDTNDPVFTPVWTNTIDAVSPEGSVIDVTQHGDSAYIACDGTDERSGIWKYEVYAQPGVGASWLKVGECYADSAMIAYEVFDGIDYGFCALAVDSAGNVEQKELLREMSLMPFSPGDVNGDQRVTISDAVGIVNLVLNTNTEGLNRRAADVNDDNTISIADAVIVVNMVTHASPLSAKTRDEEVWDVQFHIKPEVVEIGQTLELPIVLAGDTCDITALQMDVALPHGLSLVNVHTDINHIAVHAAQEDTSERVALISLSNEILARPDVMTLQLRVDNDFEGGFIKIGNAELVTARLLSLHPRDAQVAVVLNGTDAIDWLEAEDQDTGTYTLQGSKATKSDHGVLIQNGQKNFIEKRNE